MDKHRIDNILRVFRTLHRLKELPRQGFIYFGFKGDETDSIAEHSFVVTWIAYILAQQLKEANFPDTDDQFVRRVTKIALIHDWSEAVLGDLGYLVKSEKLAAIEKRAYEALVEILPLGGQEELTTLWNAYESRNSLESAIVKSADSLDAWFQGLATSTTWWPAWEDYNRKTENTLKEKCNQPELAEIFRRTSDLAKYPHVGIMLPHAKNTHLSDDDLRELIYFIKNIYNLKELPRHGFTIFGMKRSETDSFAGHMFTAASLSYLLSMEMEMSPEEQHKAIMTALIHDLPVAITGDASYDLQESAQDAWRDSENRAIKKLTTVLCKSSRNEIESLFKEWNSNSKSDYTWIAQTAAALDAWEIGVTTPTAWMDAWIDYRRRKIGHFEANGASQEITEILRYGYNELSRFKDTEEDGVIVGKEPIIKPIRL